MTDWDIEPPVREHARTDSREPGTEDRQADSWRQVASQRPRRTWLLTIALVVVTFVVGWLVGIFLPVAGGHDEDVAVSEATERVSELEKAFSDSEDRNWTYYRENQALKAELEQLRTGTGGAGTTSSSLSGPLESLGDGVYLVGEDILPGTYDGVVTGEVGYWARLSATDGSTHAIVANGLPRGPFVLTVIPADKAVELRGVEITLR